MNRYAPHETYLKNVVKGNDYSRYRKRSNSRWPMFLISILLIAFAVIGLVWLGMNIF